MPAGAFFRCRSIASWRPRRSTALRSKSSRPPQEPQEAVDFGVVGKLSKRAARKDAVGLTFIHRHCAKFAVPLGGQAGWKGYQLKQTWYPMLLPLPIIQSINWSTKTFAPAHAGIMGVPYRYPTAGYPWCVGGPGPYAWLRPCARLNSYHIYYLYVLLFLDWVVAPVHLALGLARPLRRAEEMCQGLLLSVLGFVCDILFLILGTARRIARDCFPSHRKHLALRNSCSGSEVNSTHYLSSYVLADGIN